MNVTDPIRRHATLTPAATAYLHGDLTEISYLELERTIDTVANRMRELGLTPGQSAALHSVDYYRFIVATLALARVGVASAPISLPAHLTDVAFVDRGLVANGCPRVVVLDDLWPTDQQTLSATPPASIHRDDAAIFLNSPSSGTTGTPKFIPVSHDLAFRRLALRALALPLPVDVRQVCYVGVDTHLGFSSVLRVLWVGGSVVEPPRKRRQVEAWLVRSRVNYMVTSPIALQRLVAQLPSVRGPYALRTIEVAGSTLPPAMFELARQRLCDTILSLYGSTESAGVASAPVSLGAGRPLAGYAFPGVEIEIVDADDRPVAPGNEGIVRIRSELNARGYLDNPDASANVFRAGWMYPGDLGTLAPDGLLTISGRTDDVINRGGDKISPQAIEEVLMTLADLGEVAVFGIPIRQA